MKTRILSWAMLCLSICIYSQKSAPVAGDAAQLIDFLKKDYSTISPELRNDDLAKDRARVIGIFKSYLEEIDKKKANNQKVILKDKKGNIIKESYQDILDTLTKSKNNLQTVKSQSVSIGAPKNLSSYKTEIEGLEEKIFKAKKKLYWITHQKDDAELKKLRELYKDGNKYLYELIEKFSEKYSALIKSTSDGYSEVNYRSSIQKSLPFLGGNLAFETAIDGLSRFLADRIKEELTTYVVKEVQKQLNNPSPTSYLNELMVLLPRTTEYLKRFEADQILNFIDEMKQFIEGDLNSLLKNATNLKNTPRFIVLIEQNPDLDFAFEALELIPQLSKVKNPIDYFDILENSRVISRWSNEDDSTKKDIAIGIRLTSMFAHSLTVLDNGELKFATVDFMSNYGSEKYFQKAYIGFLHQQNIKYYNDISFEGEKKDGSGNEDKYIFKIIMDNEGKYKNKIATILTQIVTPAERIYSGALSIKNSSDNNQKVSIENVDSFVKGVISLSQTAIINIQELFDIAKENSIINNSICIEKNTAKYFQLAEISSEIFSNIHRKKFSLALINSLEIYSLLVKHNGKKIPSIVPTSEALIKNLEIVSVTLAILSEKKYSKSRKGDLRDLALNLDKLLEKIEWDKSNINTNNIYITYKALIKSIDEENSNKDYITNLKALKTALITDVNSFINDFALIDLDKFPILIKVIEFIEENITDHSDKVKKEISDKIKNLIKEFIKTAINNETLDFKSIKLKKRINYDNALKDIKVTVRAFAPEIIQETFSAKDNSTMKLIYFLNDVALSETSDDVEKAISAFVLPTGSFSLKQKTGAYVSINSFPGILVGSEQRNFSNMSFTTGFTAPIGIYTKVYEGIGLFAPVIDIAAPVRFRLDNDNTTKTLPEFNLINILSPGLYITWRPIDSPFTLNIGGQIGPELQKIDANTTTIFNDSFRVGIGLTLDIPLLTLYSRPKLD